jgi:hypothetical protein
VKRLFERQEVVAQAYVLSLTETWGDKLIATTLQKIGVYLDERYTHFFNGERPTSTRVRPDRWCAPLLSFHGLANPDEMHQIGLAFDHDKRPVLWSYLWSIFGAPDVSSFKASPIRAQQDHVGPTDEHCLTIPDIPSAQLCLQKCEKNAGRCLAWTWDEKTGTCHIAPWMIIGEKPEGRYSGINVWRAQKLARGCPT